MKKYIFICAAMLTASAAQAQKTALTVPPAVKTAFAKKFPAAKKVEWSKENETEFEAEFKIGSVEQSANFDATGKWLETETEIKKTDLPAAVLASINKDFAGYDIEEAEKIEKPEAATIYEVKAEKGKTAYEVKIAADGKIIKKELEKEGKDGEYKDKD